MMLIEVFKEAWTALGRNRVRSMLTMTGISWGIVAVTLLLSYGSGFRSVLLYTFEVFGKGAVICWPGTTSEQAGGERAGKPVRFEQEDADWVKAQSPLVKRVTLETVKFLGISHDERLSDSAIRGVYPEYGEMRNEVPSEGRWISADDIAERRRVVFFRQLLFQLRRRVRVHSVSRSRGHLGRALCQRDSIRTRGPAV
jgi:putative ABC transport system permease protein